MYFFYYCATEVTKGFKAVSKINLKENFLRKYIKSTKAESRFLCLEFINYVVEESSLKA